MNQKVVDINQKVVDINEDDIVSVMTSLAVPYETARDLIRDGINVDYIKTGLKNEIEQEVSNLKSNYTNIFSEMIKTEFES